MANNKKHTNAEKKAKREQHNRRVNNGARIMAIIMIGIMVIFTVIMGILPLL